MLLDAHQLRRVDSEQAATAGVLVLHGGTDDAERAARPARRSFPTLWLRTDRIAAGVVRRTSGRGVGVWTLRHSLAGWDGGAEPTPVLEARAAIDAIREQHDDLPIVLVGYSMGGRTAVAVADSPRVAGVVGLAPWLPESQSPDPLRHLPLRVAHARLDHECPLRSMLGFLTRARSVAASVQVDDLGWDLHYLLREKRWDAYAAGQVLDLLDHVP